MSASDGIDTSGSAPSPDGQLPQDTNLSNTVAWDVPVHQFAGVRDPGTKLAGSGFVLLTSLICFQLDIPHKEIIINCAILVGGLFIADGPKLAEST